MLVVVDGQACFIDFIPLWCCRQAQPERCFSLKDLPINWGAGPVTFVNHQHERLVVACGCW